MNKLLHIIPYAYLGGTEKDCLYIVKTDKLYKHQIFVLDIDGPMRNQWEKEGADVVILDILKYKESKFTLALFDKIANNEYSAILYWSTIKLPLVRYALRKMKCRLAVHVGNPSMLSPISSLKQMFYHTYYHSNIETCLFPCSEFVRKSLIINPYYNKFQMRVSLNPVRLLPENPYKAKEITIESEVIVGMTARLDPIKDHATLIKAFSKILLIFQNAKLWLIGDGDLRFQLEELVTRLHIEKNVVFWGRVDNVYDLLQQMDIFVYSTTMKEGLGNAVSEAMTNGLPCIVSDLPMMHEIAGEKSDTVIYFNLSENDLAEKIEALILDNEMRQKMSEASFYRSSQAFSAKRYFDERMQFLLNS